MKMDNFTGILDWDSCFFGQKIAKIVVEYPDEKYVEEKLQEYKTLGFDLVYIFLKGKTKLPASLCSSYHCALVDRKLVYQAAAGGEYEASPFVMEFHGEPSALYELALQSGVDSRYRLDKRFPVGDFERLYKVWVDNSVAGLIADKVFVFTGWQENIDGFVTVKTGEDGASIGLIATDLRARGKGIGSQLLTAVKRYAKEREAETLRVATQEQNLAACSFYEKNGFLLQSETNIYHAWLKDE